MKKKCHKKSERKKEEGKENKPQELNVVSREHNTIEKNADKIHSIIHVIGQRKQV